MTEWKTFEDKTGQVWEYQSSCGGEITDIRKRSNPPMLVAGMLLITKKRDMFLTKELENGAWLTLQSDGKRLVCVSIFIDELSIDSIFNSDGQLIWQKDET